MSSTSEPRDISIWDGFPRGIIMAWYGEGGLPKELTGKWAFCDGEQGRPNLIDGRFLRGSDKIDSKPGSNIGGTSSHRHIVAHTDRRDGNGFATESDNNAIGITDEQDHTPPFFNVRFVIRI